MRTKNVGFRQAYKVWEWIWFVLCKHNIICDKIQEVEVFNLKICVGA